MPSKQCPVTPNSFWMANPVLNTGHFTSYMGMEHHGTHDMGPMGPAKKNVDHLIWYPFKAWWLFNTFHPNMWLFCSLNHYNELFGSVLWAGQRFCDLWIQLPFTDRTVLRCAVICRRGANAGAFLGSTGWNGQDETLLLTGAWYEIGNWSIISIFTIIPFPIPYWAAVIKSFWKKNMCALTNVDSIDHWRWLSPSEQDNCWILGDPDVDHVQILQSWFAELGTRPCSSGLSSFSPVE